MLNAGKSKVKGKAKIQAQSNCNGRGKVQDKANGNVKVPAEDKGKAKVKAPLEVNETTSGLSVNDLAVRPRYSRDTGKQLDMTTDQLIKVMRKQVELLEAELLRRKQETDPYYLALVLAKIEILDFEEKNKELRTMLENREKLKGWLAAWVNSYIVRKGGPNYMELTLLQDDEGRRRGSVYMTNRSHIMSQIAYPYKPFGNSIEDKTEVKIHRGEDEHGVCIMAYENYVHFTVEGNYENVAKTWRFDYTESTPLYTVLMVEKMDEDILYIIQEHNELKLKRISVSGVFPGYPGQDRITITHAGIAVDERFPFGDGETRVNGFQWSV
ncbi:hypothetical protein LEN26_013608 [Aphanomyces euteiches]|nr:hypothetical protein LEN26_013608 [Aphanomyces euteiches]